MKRLFVLLGACGLSLAANVAEAQVGINSLQTFDAAPPVTSFSSISVPGAGGTFALVVDLEVSVQTNTAAGINTPLVTNAGSGTGAQAQWSSGGRYVYTRPTGIAYHILMATIQNTTVGDLPSPVISYNLGQPNALAGEDAELQGHRVYYSLTGDANSWTLIPELTSPQAPNPIVPGGLLATLSLGSWPPGSLLYVIWVDDNGGPAGDGSFSIDNFNVTAAIECPAIVQAPGNTNNLVGRTVSLTVVASGPGLTYQWNLVGVGPIDPGVNPSAATPTLVIANAQLSDSGAYTVTVANSCGNVTSSSGNIQIDPDTMPPVFLRAYVVGPLFNTFRLDTDEAWCIVIDPQNPPPCGVDSVSSFNWLITPSDDPSPLSTLGVLSVIQINATTYEFTTVNPRDPTKQYRITVDEFGEVADIYGNRVPAFTYAETLPQISFQQNVNGYTGTQDAELHSNASAATPLGANPTLTVDNDDAGIAQALLRFDNIFGSDPGQVPLGAEIISATLAVQVFDAGGPVNLHRFLLDWDQTSATWDLFTGGVTADDVEARIQVDGVLPTAVGLGSINVLTTVQAWANGEPNRGWALLSTSGDGWDINTSENAATPPALTITYRVVPCVGVPTISTQPPAAVAANEAQSFSITVGLNNACGTLQWTKDDADITGANGSTYTVASASPADNGSYRLRVTNPGGEVTSSAAVVTVTPDTTGPTVLSASGGATPTSVTITFSKVVSAATAENTANYSITPSLAVSSAVLGANGTTVTLTTADRTVGTRYVVTIRNIRDTRFNQNLLAPNPTLVPLAYQVPTPLLVFTDTWKYEQSGTDLGTAWRAPGYDDSAWPSGPGVLGFETSAATITYLQGIAPPNGTNTVLSLTNAAGATNPTIYFRTTFNNTYPPAPGITFTMRAYIDDGAVWFVNGTESGRYNITITPTLFNTLADAASPEAATVTANLTGVTLGVNTLAAEVHQNALTSSDIAWGAEILVNIGGPGLQIVHNSNGTVTISWDGLGSLQEAPAVTGPWSNSASQTNPQTRASSGGAQFFRLQFTAP